ncbi:hypothetical protein F5Y08DRAFT_91973 [Xylaria arbuscula]|nr:hypothetical protein F5Y08DRAFT_91973 [Xylaria arbuscula]
MLGSHRDNAHFTRAGWRKRVILPCWIIQILILLSVMGLFSYRLSHTVATWKEEDDKGTVPVVEFVWEVVNIAFSLFSLLVTFISVARYIAEVLTPLSLLFGCILNMTLSAVVLALDIVIYVQRTDRNYSTAGLGLDTALIFFTIIPLIYSIIIYRRLLNYDDYHLPYNHKAFGFAAIEEGPDDHRFSTNLGPPSPYDPTNPGSTSNLGTTTTVIGGEPQSTTRGRSVSIGSRRISISFSGRNVSVSPHPSPPLPLETAPPPSERRASYDHKRDTQFEDYVASRRASQQRLRGNSNSSMTFQEDVKRALGDEFGFGESPSESILSGKSGKGEILGTVPAGHASRPRVASIGRQTSFEAVVGGGGGISVTITTPPEEAGGEMVQRGHSLNSVPEAEEELHNHHHHHHHTKSGNESGGGRKRALSESKQALLGGEGGGEGDGRRSPPRIERVEGLEDVELQSRERKA